MREQALASNFPQGIMTPGSGVRKAAILVLTLGQDVARDVFTRLEEWEIRALAEAASTFDKVGDKEIIEVLAEFRRSFDGGVLPSHGAGRVFQIMVERSLGEERARALLGPRISDDPFVRCASVNPRLLSRVLTVEHPQTAAIVLASLRPTRAAEVLQNFDPDAAAEVVYRMAHLGSISEEVRAEMGNTLMEQLESMGTLQSVNLIDGEQTAVDVTKALPGDYSDQVMLSLEATDLELAADIRAKLFVFDDLARLDARAMQRLLREIDSKQLMLALKGASESVQELVFESVSARAAEMLRDDMESAPPVRVADAEEAQETILDVAFRLESEGVIVLPRGGGSEMV